MVLTFIHNLHNLHDKLENHQNHNHDESKEALSASLQAFQSTISTHLTQFSSNFATISLQSFQQCFQLLPMINKAFAKLVLDLDHPVNKWESNSIEEYLNYTLNLLDLLNAISSCLSHMGHARVCLSHALTLLNSSPSSAIEHIKAIRFDGSWKEFKFSQAKAGDVETTSFIDKEMILHQALLEMKSIGTWVGCVVLACLSNHPKIYLEMRKLDGIASNSSLSKLDSSVCEVIMQKGCVIKEVKELKDAAALLESDMTSAVAEELQRKLEAFEKIIDDIGKEVDVVFSEVLAGRSELLGSIRNRRTEQQ